jgi:hypothetical protein
VVWTGATVGDGRISTETVLQYSSDYRSVMIYQRLLSSKFDVSISHQIPASAWHQALHPNWAPTVHPPDHLEWYEEEQVKVTHNTAYISCWVCLGWLSACEVKHRLGARVKFEVPQAAFQRVCIKFDCLLVEPGQPSSKWSAKHGWRNR